MLVLLLAAATAQTPIDAERAFAADAQAIGQWSAFRKWSTDDAIMFTPRAVKAHAFLKDRKNPPRAIRWWPTASYISCDGSLAANTGGWKRPDGRVGYFTTIWRRQPGGGWKWILDHGDALAKPRTAVARPGVRRAACGSRPNQAPPTIGVVRDGPVRGESADGTLGFTWKVEATGARWLTISLWRGGGYDFVIDDKVAAPK